MNIMRPRYKITEKRWLRYHYNLTTPMGEGGKRLSGSEEHIALSRKVAGEGMVLLENNGLLPLKKGTTVSLFGFGSLDYVKGGGGSGQVYCQYVRNLYEGFVLQAPDYAVYEPVTKYYYDYAMAHMEEHDSEKLFDELELPAELIADAAKNSDVAIISIHRYSREHFDRFAEKGDFYLTDEEQKLVDDVTAAFDHCAVVLNVGGMIDVDWIKKNPKIDAALMGWQAGMEGGLVMADILCGKINPSGKLTDTFAKTFADYPSSESFNASDDYVCYYEDIYVGYRYFETIPGAKDRVNYPFGYGLSYTTFELSKPEAALKGDSIEVKLTVKNTGAVAGKEVAQVYYSAPQGVLGKPAIELAAFKKTALLQPGEAEEIVLSFPVSDMASYDDLGKLQMSAYLLEQGEYRILAGNNCRDLQEADYRYKVEEPFVVTRQLTQKCAPNKIEKRMLADGSFEPLPSFPVKEYKDYEIEAPLLDAVTPEHPKRPGKLWKFEDVADGKLTLEQFMMQLTDDELIQLMSGTPDRGVANTKGFGGIPRLQIPAFMTVDGPAGIRLTPRMGLPTTAWPCATLIACTWDPALIYEIGVAGAREAKEHGLAIWLTPALNIHRTPLCGRNFEYFSEDPLIAGKFAAAKVNGIQSQKIGASAKHFACNNKEINRKMSDSRLSERALREIYLRGFEICVKEAQPWTIMSSYNIINDRRCCTSYEQLNGILREEWGFKGVVTTDWNTPCDQTYCVLAGNDVRMPVGDPDLLKESLYNNRITRGHLEKNAKRMLELFLKFE